MDTSIKNLSDSQAELTVTLEKNELLGYIDKTEKELARGLRLDGFRPGKAPKDAVRKELGENAVRQEALELAVKTSLEKAIVTEKLDVIDQLDLKIKENNSDKLTYQASFLIMPQIQIGPHRDLGVKKYDIDVSQEEVTDVIKEITKSRAVVKEVDRSADKNDRVEIDFTVRDGGTVIDGGKSENHPVVIGENKFVPGFEDKLIGMTVGETRNFPLPIPEDYYHKKIAGKNLDFEVTLKKVVEVSTPSLDDNFARSVGNFESISELEQNIKQGLVMEKEQKEKERVRRVILEKIAVQTKVDLPRILIDRQVEAMTSDLDKDLHQKGLELGPYLAQLGKTQEEFKKDLTKRAEVEVKHALITRTIAKEEKIDVSPEEVESEVQTMIQQLMLRGGESADPEALKNVDPIALKGRVRKILLEDKISEFLEKNNTV
ncbi:MAG: trigger factor [Candidatus Yanofskybacteria bacterium]|nr:trigger factor [Candidatus Yanofskybacteria bacterium]